MQGRRQSSTPAATRPHRTCRAAGGGAAARRAAGSAHSPLRWPLDSPRMQQARPLQRSLRLCDAEQQRGRVGGTAPPACRHRSPAHPSAKSALPAVHTLVAAQPQGHSRCQGAQRVKARLQALSAGKVHPEDGDVAGKGGCCAGAVGAAHLHRKRVACALRDESMQQRQGLLTTAADICWGRLPHGSSRSTPPTLRPAAAKSSTTNCAAYPEAPVTSTIPCRVLVARWVLGSQG